MPATEQTWRKMTTLHAVFGASAVLMLVSTVWMFAKDHTREWKALQATQEEIDQFYTAARLREEQTGEYRAKETKWERAAATARSSAVVEQLADKFAQAVNADRAARQEEPLDFAALHADRQDLDKLAAAAAKSRAAAQEARAQVQPLMEKAIAAEIAGDRTAADARARADVAKLEAERLEELQRGDEKAAAAIRGRMLASMDDTIRDAQFREDNRLREMKAAKADLTAELSLRDIGVGEGRPASEVDTLQAKVEASQHLVADVTARYDAAKDYRQELERIVHGDSGITADEDAAVKGLSQTQLDLKRLEESLQTALQKPGRWTMRMPILDAFDTSDRQVDQLWLPDLTINYNFSDVARFDRCITCHRSIDKTAPGSAVEPAYAHQQAPFALRLPTPSRSPAPRVDEAGESHAPTLQDVYGFALASRGIIERDDVTIEAVWPETPAAEAGLKMGDVIERIGDVLPYSPGQVRQLLLEEARWGEPLQLTVRRGLPHPYAAHPRLDLFGGSFSPHLFEKIGCTICHDGQGSATEFKWASHFPNDPHQAEEWRDEHGWFDNHHWIFPMQPQRFLESNCLKCHFEVEELEESERYPEPPAPKLVEGYNLVRSYGCFGCHEINGYDGPDRRVGPDLRSEPMVYAAAHALLSDGGLTDEERQWATRLIAHPEEDATRRRLWEVIDGDSAKARAANPEEPPRLAAGTHKLGAVLKDVEIPGTRRKVGPSLRFVASKLDYDFLYSWIRKPADFRPTTRMPQFFGQWEHLDDQERNFSYKNAAGELQEVTDLHFTQRYEEIEVFTMADTLLGLSKPWEYLPRPAEVTEEPSVERGKQALQLRGCLACHSHPDFPGVTANQGPNLAQLGGKLRTADGAKWLYTWLRQPSSYHTRTKMPDVFLTPIAQPDGKVTDPAADIAAFLLSQDAWKPENVPAPTLDAERQKALFDLALEHLAGQFPERRARQYLESGIPESMAGRLKGDEVVLLGMTAENRQQKQVEYVGRRTISKFGCAGCHDIPGFEDAKPIGTALAGWGRKEPSKLAFEQIGQFLLHHGVDAHAGAASHEGSHEEGDRDDGGHATTERHDGPHDISHGGADAHSADAHADAHGGGHGIDPLNYDPDTGYFLMALQHHNRQGFLWQKLRMPRSYDYEKTSNKGYNERLRMPLFPLDDAQREKVMTFVLGLTAEPAPEKFVSRPSPRSQARIDGRQVINKYNCAGCHQLYVDRWEFDYLPSDFRPPPKLDEFPFLVDHFPPDAVEKSLATDRRGLRHAVVHGRPTIDEKTGRPIRYDEDGVPLEEGDDEEAFYAFVLWRPALINGQVRPPGVQNLSIRDAGIRKFPSLGGTLADYLFPVVIANEKERNPQVKGSEAWGWLPPPLEGEGRKVQTDWLHDFLLEPYPIRPAVVLRMPKFNMTSDEATKLANYFAAVENADYPYEHDPRTQSSHLAAIEAERPEHLESALGIVVDNNYCVKCHLVGDFYPAGSVTAMGPNLSEVHARLRPTWVRDWLANPKRKLPYTGMPLNIPYKDAPPHFGGVSQELYPGTSIEQLDAVVDLLMNFDRYGKRQASIKPLVKPPPAGEAPAGEAPAGRGEPAAATGASRTSNPRESTAEQNPLRETASSAVN